MEYRIVIIDDSPITVKSLVECFDWGALNAKIAGTAFDGISGRNLILETNPDIVITDINMPNVDGLNMIEQIYDEIEDIKVIVITGYDEFKYASRAIKLSVFDFILKPVDDKELSVSVRRAIEEIEKGRNLTNRYEIMREYVGRAQLVSLMTMAEVNNSYIKTLQTEYNMDFSSFFIIIARTEYGIAQPLLRSVDETLKANSTRVISLIIDDALVLFCLNDSAKGEWKEEAGKIIQEIIYIHPDFVLGISDHHDNPKDIRNTYLEAKCMLSGSMLLDCSNYIGFYGTKCVEQPEQIKKIKAKCKNIVEQLDLKGNFADDLFSRITMEFKEISTRKAALFYCYINIHKEVLSKEHWLEEAEKCIKAIVKIQDLIQLKQSIKDFYMICSKWSSNCEGVLPLVGKVINYINMYSIDGLRLEDVAKKFFVSPNYLSSVIKKETGKKYHDHVLEAKLNVAKQMLDDTRMNINEIAYAVGYENYVSFYTVFKKMEKITPTQYRMRNYSNKENYE